MTKQTVFVNGDETAIVEVNRDGLVTLKRGESVRKFSNTVTYEDIAAELDAYGWKKAEQISKSSTKEEMDSLYSLLGSKIENPAAPDSQETESLAKAAQASLDQGIPLEIQQKVDEYIKLHKEANELKKKLDELKTPIKAHMEAYELKAIKGSEFGTVALQDAKASNSTSIYTDYEIGDVAPLLSKELLNKVTENRVNAQVLDGVLKSDETLSEDTIKKIKELKIVKPGTPRFVVKK